MPSKTTLDKISVHALVWAVGYNIVMKYLDKYPDKVETGRQVFKNITGEDVSDEELEVACKAAFCVLRGIEK